MAFDVTTAKDIGDTILFAKTGETIIRQIQTTSTVENRANDGVDSVAPTIEYDKDYAETTWYRTIGDETYSFTATTGTKTTTVCRRANEADMWTQTVTTDVYTLNKTEAELTALGWTKTKGGNLISDYTKATTTVVDGDKSVSYHWSYCGNDISSVTTTTVEEATHLTLAAAKAMVTANTSSGARNKAHYYTVASSSYTSGYGNAAWTYFMDGTDKRASYRYVSETEGYSVTITTVVYGWYADKVGSSTSEGWHV